MAEQKKFICKVCGTPLHDCTELYKVLYPTDFDASKTYFTCPNSGEHAEDTHAGMILKPEYIQELEIGKQWFKKGTDYWLWLDALSLTDNSKLSLLIQEPNGIADKDRDDVYRGFNILLTALYELQQQAYNGNNVLIKAIFNKYHIEIRKE